MRRNMRAGHAINVKRERGAARGRYIAQPVNCAAPRADKRHRAARPVVAARLNCSMRVGIPREERFGQRSFDDRISAPGVMTVHRACLAGLPDERGDGVSAERIGNQQMPSITIQPAFALGIGQKAGLPGDFFESRPHAKREFRRRWIETTGLIEGMG